MTATTTSIGTRRGRAAMGHTRHLARLAGALLRTISARWHEVVSSGQFGPSAETVTSRHTGGRI